MTRHALLADLLDFSDDPGWSAADDAPDLRFRADHWLLIDELLDWLATDTFPAEARYADAAVCEASTARFLGSLLAHGTTSAMVFPTVHRTSADALFAAAQRLFAWMMLADERNLVTTWVAGQPRFTSA